MTIRNLDALFAPASKARISTDPTTGTVAGFLSENLISAGFKGGIFQYMHRARLQRVKQGIRRLPDSPNLSIGR